MIIPETALQDAQTLNLLPNVSKFYAWQVGSWMNEQQSQNLLLKVDLLPTIRNNKLNMEGEKLVTAKFLYQIYCRCLQLNRRYRRYSFLILVFRRLKNTAQGIYFVL